MNLPNKITLTRIMFIPVFVLFFYLDVMPYNLLIAGIIFALAASTDFLDGHIARSRNLVTNMGKFLDPIADKVLNATALILLLTNSLIFVVYGTWGNIVAGVCVALIIARELIISGFRLVAVERRAVIAADKLGKIKTVAQDFAIGYLIIATEFLYISPRVLCILALVFMVIITFLTAVSGANYIIKNRQVLREEEKSE